MKVKLISLLAILALFAACDNPFVGKILPDRNGNEKTYTVTFDRGAASSVAGAEANPRTITVLPGAAINVMPEPPTAEGYAFLHWKTTSDNTGDTFTAETPVTADITVYAQWLYAPPGSFIVTFHKNGGDADADPATKVVMPSTTNVGSLPTPPTRSGYHFAGWNTQPNGSGSAFTASTTVTASITVYAQWTPGGTPPASAVVDFEDYTLGPHSGVVKGYNTNGDVLTPTVNIVNNPLNAGQKSMSISSTDYGQAAIVPITLPAALNTAESFTFRFLLPSGTISYKKVLVYIASSADTFVTGGFGNPIDSQYAQFAANKLGETEEINNSDENVNITLNEWKTYTISINGASLNAAISGLSGKVYLAIGIHHSSTEAITYLLDDLTFNFGGPPPPPAFSTLVDFEADALGAPTTYTYTSGNNTPYEFEIVADPAPANGSTKSLKMTNGQGSSGNAGYNQAVVIPINIPDALNTYRSLRFRFYLNGAGTLAENNRTIQAYVASDTATFVRYAFGNPSTGANNFAANLLGAVAPEYTSTGQWVDYAINFSSPGSAISGLSGNVYVAIGINHDASITYYLDDLTFSKQELIKQPGAALTGPLTVNTDSITQSSVEINAVSAAPSNGQTVEYAVAETTATPSSGWQDDPVIITGLKASTAYYAFARSKSNAQYNAGEAIRSASTFTTLAKDPSTAVLTPPTPEWVYQKTHNRIQINAVTGSSLNGQTIEYSISETSGTPGDTWQDGLTFSGLFPDRDYYIFARAKENAAYSAGAAISSGAIHTEDGPQLNTNVPPVIVDFEDDALGATTKYSVTQGNGSGTVTIVADPHNAGQKSLNMNSTNYNRGAVIPINLPFALEKYQSFTFRFRVASGTPSNPEVSVYIADATSKFVNYGFGNPSGNANQFANLLLGEVTPNFSANQWVEYEIEIDGANLNSAIKTLQGNLYLAIGINSSGTIDLQFDDLTFNALYGFAPDPSITPTTATFALSDQKDIPVIMNLYGYTLSDIKNGSTSLQQSPISYYEVDGNTVTLKEEYFTGMTAGTTVTLNFEFSGTGGTKISTIEITISATSLVTAYTFSNYTTQNVPVTINGGSITVSVTNGALRLQKTTNNDTSYFILPFNLGGTKLGSYSAVRIVVKSSSGDLTYKTLAAQACAGSTWTGAAACASYGSTGGSDNLAGQRDLAITATNQSTTPGSLEGNILIGISFGQTTSYVIEIESITLVK